MTNDDTAFGNLLESDSDSGVLPLALGVEESKECSFDLAERTALFGEATIRFAKTIPYSAVNGRLIDQLVGAATSVGANYCEANDSISPGDFRHRIALCRKEAKETQFFLRMVAASEPTLRPNIVALWKEAGELNKIFSAIWRRTPSP